MTDPHDPMDTRLREYADRWRAAATPPPIVPPERLGRGGSWRTWSLVLATAAAIGVMILGASQLVGTHAPAEVAPPVTSTTPTSSAVATESGPVERTPLSRDDALRRALAADVAVRAEVLGGLEPRGPVVCGIHVMGSSADEGTLYLWLTCGDYAVVDGVAKEQTGSHEPAVVQVRGSGADLVLEKVSFPRQQSLDADIKRLFPPSIASHIYDDENTRTMPSGKELEAEAVASAG
jgi:hypothetical protein